MSWLDGFFQSDTPTVAANGTAKASCAAASTANITNLASASVTQDGITLVAGDRLLVWMQSASAQNGIYVVDTVGGGLAQLTRATDFDTPDDVSSGATVFVRAGVSVGGHLFGMTSTTTVVFGVTAITFVDTTSGGSAGGTTSIGTAVSPGTLRGILGDSSLNTFLVGSFHGTIGDGGGGPFYWDATSTATDDGGTIINPTGNITGRWLRVFNGHLFVDWFGAKGDTTTGSDGTDDGDAFRAALAVAKAKGGVHVAMSPKKYRCGPSGGITFTFDSSQGVSLGGVANQTGLGGSILYLSGVPTNEFISMTGAQHPGIRDCVVIVVDPTATGSHGVIKCSNGSGTGGASFERVTFSGPTLGKVISGATNATPIEITTTTNHTYTTGDYVIVNAVAGNPGANGNWAITVTAANKFTLTGSAGTGAYTSGGACTRPTIKRWIHLGNTLLAEVRRCKFNFAQVGIYGQGEGSSEANAMRGNTFQDCAQTGILNPGEGWDISFNTFEGTTGIAVDGAGTDAAGCSITGNWFGDNAGNSIYVDMFGAQGFNISGNLFGGSGGPMIRLDVAHGISLTGNYFGGPNEAITFGSSAQSNGVFVAANLYGGTDANLVTNRGFCAVGLTVLALTTAAINTPVLSGGTVLTGGGLSVQGSFAGVAGALNVSTEIGTKPTFDANSGAIIARQSAAYGDGLGLAYFPIQNNHTSGHNFYGYDPAVTTYKQHPVFRVDPLGTTLEGSAALGGEHSLLVRERVFYNTINNGANTSLLDPLGAATIALVDGYLYDFTARFLVSENSATPGKRYKVTWTAIVGCIAGVATILESSSGAESDPDAAGITTSLSVTGASAFLAFKVNNGSGVTVWAMADVKWSALKTS